MADHEISIGGALLACSGTVNFDTHTLTGRVKEYGCCLLVIDFHAPPEEDMKITRQAPGKFKDQVFQVAAGQVVKKRFTFSNARWGSALKLTIEIGKVKEVLTFVPS